ncbi:MULTISPECIES: hypothetical protein [Halorussus]|nr:hypothetical protein [Halorussus vallis]USZ78585.1 hypothetical protein NGM07_24870 [Halorussus vallis]
MFELLFFEYLAHLLWGLLIGTLAMTAFLSTYYLVRIQLLRTRVHRA